MFSLERFAAHLLTRVVEMDHAAHEGLTKAAKIVEKEAKAEIGHYQDAAGPFPAWAELADSTKEDRASKGYPDNDPLLREGTMRDSIGHEVSHHEAVVGSNSDIAVYQELGTQHIPPRSFLGGAAARKSHEVGEILGHEAVKGLIGASVAGRYLPVP